MVKVRTCECCGQTLPSELGVKIPASYEHLFKAIQKAGEHGIRSDRLFEMEYAGVRDGGPKFDTLSARIYYLNKRHLLAQGLRIVGEYVGGNGNFGRYRIVKVTIKREPA